MKGDSMNTITKEEISAVLSQIAPNYPIKIIYPLGSEIQGGDVGLSIFFSDGITSASCMFSSFIKDLEKAFEKSVDCITDYPDIKILVINGLVWKHN